MMVAGLLKCALSYDKYLPPNNTLNAIYLAKTGSSLQTLSGRSLWWTYECISNLSPQQMPSIWVLRKKKNRSSRCRKENLNLNLAVEQGHAGRLCRQAIQTIAIYSEYTLYTIQSELKRTKALCLSKRAHIKNAGRQSTLEQKWIREAR